MKPSEYDTMFAVEERHWWYVGMQRITIVLMEELYPAQRDLHILDAGCGTGAAMRYLGRFGQVTGCDFSALALSYCQQRGLTRLSEASVMCLPFAANSFDLVTSFDVLYHRAVEVELVALRDFWRVLKPGGKVLILEFSRPSSAIKPAYDLYSFKVLPLLGKLVARDEDSYQYLAESIRMHPDQETLLGMLRDAGFERCRYDNLTGGIVALHTGYKI